MAGGDLVRQLGDGSSRTTRWSATVLAPGVARTEHRRERTRRCVGEAEQRVEPEPALVGRAGALLVLGVDLDERGVDVEDDRTGPVGRRRPAPDLVRAPRRAPWRWPLAASRGDLVEGPPHRRVRGHEPEQVLLGAQVLDVGAALAATGEHQAAWTSTLPRSCSGPRSPVIGIARRERITEPNRSAKQPRAWSPTWATTWSPPGSTTTGTRAGSFHLVGALLSLRSDRLRNPQNRRWEGHVRGVPRWSGHRSP